MGVVSSVRICALRKALDSAPIIYTVMTLTSYFIVCWSLYFLLYKMSIILAAAAAKSLHMTLCDPIDGSPPGSPIPGILQARTLEWAAISFSNA